MVFCLWAGTHPASMLKRKSPHYTMTDRSAAADIRRCRPADAAVAWLSAGKTLQKDSADAVRHCDLCYNRNHSTKPNKENNHGSQD